MNYRKSLGVERLPQGIFSLGRHTVKDHNGQFGPMGTSRTPTTAKSCQ